MQTKRPFVITCLSICLTFFALLLAIVVLFNPYYSQAQLAFVGSQCGITAFLVRHFGVKTLQMVSALFSLSIGAIGCGLWRLSRWARISIIVVSLLGVCSGIEQIIEFKYAHSCRSVDLTGFFLSGALLLYFSRPKVKQMFHLTSPVPA